MRRRSRWVHRCRGRQWNCHRSSYALRPLLCQQHQTHLAVRRWIPRGGMASSPTGGSVATADLQTGLVANAPSYANHEIQQTAAIRESISDSNVHAQSNLQLSSNRFDEVWLESQSKIKSGELVDVLLSLSMLYRDTSLTTEQKDRLIPLLDQLAGSVVYSSNVQMDAPYVVAAGQTIESIAAENSINPAFIIRTNQLNSQQLTPGQRLKMVRGPFRAELSISSRELTLFLGRYYAGRFPVAIGREFPTNLSMLEVSEVAGARDYIDPRTGERISAGDPNNPYGNYWIGLSGSTTSESGGLGIHAYGAAVGASDTRGCVSLSPEDADDLQAILTVGAIVEVVP